MSDNHQHVFTSRAYWCSDCGTQEQWCESCNYLMPHSCGVKINKGPNNKFKVIPDFLDYMITKSGKIRRVANHQRVLFERITSEGAVLVRLYRDDVPHIVSVEDLVNQTYGPEGFRYESPVVKKGEQMSDTIIPESNLVLHARRELELLGSQPEIDEHVMQIVEIFSRAGHSGSSAYYTIELISRLLSYQNLTPLTDNPDEWECHDEGVSGVPGGLWQNKRNGEAFSNDGGVTYYLLNEGANANNPLPLHHSNSFHTRS